MTDTERLVAAIRSDPTQIDAYADECHTIFAETETTDEAITDEEWETGDSDETSMSKSDSNKSSEFDYGML